MVFSSHDMLIKDENRDGENSIVACSIFTLIADMRRTPPDPPRSPPKAKAKPNPQPPPPTFKEWREQTVMRGVNFGIARVDLVTRLGAFASRKNTLVGRAIIVEGFVQLW